MKQSNWHPWSDIPDEFPIHSWDSSHDLLAPLFIQEKSGNAFRASERKFSESPLEVFPGVYSWDYDYQRFLDLLSRKCSEAFPAEVDEYGRVFGAGVRSNFYSLRHLPGAPMSPATFVLGDNRKKRKDAKLADGPVSALDEELFRAVIECVFRGYENNGLRVARNTSTGVPFFASKMPAKLTIASNALRDACYAADLISSGNAERAYTDTFIGGAYFVVFREQTSDKIVMTPQGVFEAKERTVADADYARTGGRKGRLFAASKDPSDLANMGYRVHDGFFRTRRRVAQAGPFHLNSIMMAVAQPCRNKMYEDFSFSWHHTTRLQKQKKVHQFDDVIATDVSDHDTFWPADWFVPLIVDELKKLGFKDEFLTLFELGFRLPVYVSTPSADEALCHKLIGDWRTPNLSQGLPSGNGFTDLMGSALMTACYMILQLDHVDMEQKARLQQMLDAGATVAVREWVQSYLRGEEKIAQMSKSDDALLLSKGALLSERMAIVREKMKEGVQLSPYMLISYEHGYAFLGDVLLFDTTKKLANTVFIGNINSYLANMFVPEYSIDTDRPRHLRRRPFPGISFGTAAEVFGSCPIWKEVNEVIEECWYKIYNQSFRALRIKQFEEDTAALATYVKQRADSVTSLNLSLIDAEVIADPSKLSWKFNVNDVNPHIVELYSHGLSPDQTYNFSLGVR